MADSEQVDRLLAGVEGWNAWRKENRGGEVDLSEADLSEANLDGANLDGANLVEANIQETNLRVAYLHVANLGHANLRGADLRRARLSMAGLRWANLDGANLEDAKLNGAYLRETNLRGANLVEVDLREADLHGAKLQRASLGDTVFANVDLQSVEGLDKVVHREPSIVDNKTLVRSRAQIPEIFLRGCGFQDWEIEAAKLHDPNLSEHEVTDSGYRVIDLKSRGPIQINPVFISYSRDDSAFVEAVEPLLDDKGIRYWRDVHDMTAGPLDEQIERAIRLNPTYLLVLSERSIESDWVEWEAQKARDLEKELRRQGDHRHVLCPVALDDSWEDAAWPKPLKHQIRKYNILDFSQWRDEERLAGMFGRLLKGLGIYYRSADSAEEV